MAERVREWKMLQTPYEAYLERRGVPVQRGFACPSIAKLDLTEIEPGFQDRTGSDDPFGDFGSPAPIAFGRTTSRVFQGMSADRFDPATLLPSPRRNSRSRACTASRIGPSSKRTSIRCKN